MNKLKLTLGSLGSTAKSSSGGAVLSMCVSFKLSKQMETLFFIADMFLSSDFTGVT